MSSEYSIIESEDEQSTPVNQSQPTKPRGRPRKNSKDDAVPDTQSSEISSYNVSQKKNKSPSPSNHSMSLRMRSPISTPTTPKAQTSKSQPLPANSASNIKLRTKSSSFASKRSRPETQYYEDSSAVVVQEKINRLNEIGLNDGLGAGEIHEDFTSDESSESEPDKKN